MSLREKREMKLLMLQGQMDQMFKVASMLQIVEDSGEEAGIPVEEPEDFVVVVEVEVVQVPPQDRMMVLLIICQVHVDVEEVAAEVDLFIKTVTTTKGHHVVEEEEADSSS